MKAVVFYGPGNVKVEDVKRPEIKNRSDVILKVEQASICGSDLHLYGGKMPLEKGRIMGHEFVGSVAEAGPDVKNVKIGDRVLVAATIADGICQYCKRGEFSMCDGTYPYTTDPNSMTMHYGSPEEAGGLDGGQAEYVRVPFADVGCVRIPNSISNEQAIAVTDAFPTAYFGMDMARVQEGDSVAVFGLGPVGQMGVLSAKLRGAREIIAIDRVPARLNMASWQGAKTIDFSKENPIEEIRRMTNGTGVDVALEAVGFAASCGTGYKAPLIQKVKGDCPEQTLDWLMECTRKAGRIAAVGIFASQPINHVNFGEAFKKNLKIYTGSCPHMKYIPALLSMIEQGKADPSFLITHRASIDQAPDMYKLFSDRADGCVKVMLACA